MKKIIILLMVIVLFIISSIGYLIIKVPSDKEILKTKELSIPLGETKKIEINTKAEYDIKDETFATVDTYGNVKGVKKGTTVISVKTRTNEYYIPVEIVDPILDINVFEHDIEVVKGNTVKLNLILKENVKVKSYEYDKSIIEVESETIKGINVGKTNLRVYTDNSYVDINVVVNDVTINISKLKTDLFINDEAELKIYTNSNNKEEIIWSSSNENVVSVNNGIIKGLDVGESTITAKAYGKEVSSLVKVIDKVDKIKSLKLNKSFLNIQLGETFDVVSYTEPSVPSNLIKYEIFDNSIVTLENNKIIPKKNGKTLLKASIYDKEYYMTIYVGNISKKFDTKYKKEKVIDIFDEVALNEEFTNRASSNLIQKWNSPIYYYYQNATNEDIKQIKKIADLLNSIPEFPGMFESNLDKSNLIIDFTNYETLLSKTSVGGVEGYSENIFGNDNIITGSNIMISFNLKQNIKNSVIAEEILHSIGLKNDTKKCSNSVLYEYDSVIEYPTDIDVTLINLLYDDSITYGMDSNAVHNKIISILK